MRGPIPPLTANTLSTNQDIAGASELWKTYSPISAGYSFHENGFIALEHLIDLCSAMPVHAVYGAKKDMMCAFQYILVWMVTLTKMFWTALKRYNKRLCLRRRGGR